MHRRQRESGTGLPATTTGTHRDAFGSVEWSLLAAVAIIWGSSFVFMAIGLDAFEPGVITLARVALGTATVALFPKARVPIEKEHRRRIVLLGVVWIAIPLMIFPIAQQWIDSSVAGMLNGGVPIASLLWAVIFLRALPRWRQAVGIGVGFVGVVAISIPGITESSSTALGVGLVLFAIVLYGLSTNLVVPLQHRYGALPVLFRAQLVALVIVTPFGLLDINGSTWAWDSALAMVPLGVLGTGLAFVLMTTLVGRAGASRGSVAIYFIPIVAMVLGVLVRSETIEPIAVAGTGAVLVGAWIASRKET
jgi:drug/metabolite transporter (DMT)-like permease